jgi:site-specific DNA-cytosine methylase
VESVLSICCGLGLLDLGFQHEGFEVLPGCEIDPGMATAHEALTGKRPAFRTLRELIDAGLGECERPADGIIGGPPCQAHTKLKAMRAPKFADLTPEVVELVEREQPQWFVFENVCPLEIPGAKHVMLNAMHFAHPPQSRERWFTYSANLTPPEPRYRGSVDDMMAYPVVAGRIYGAKRAAVLQGYPMAADLVGRIPSEVMQRGLSNAVHYEIARSWARAVKESTQTMRMAI